MIKTVSSQQPTETPCGVSIRLCDTVRALLALAMLLAACYSAVGQSKTGLSEGLYHNARLGFRYAPPVGIHDKTGRFAPLQIQNQAGTPQTLATLLAMSSGPDSSVPDWCSITIVSYPRSAVSEPDDIRAAAQMNAWVAHSKGTAALPKPAAIGGQTFTVSVFGMQEESVKKGGVVFTTIRKGKLLSFAFAANSPDRLKALTETMKTVEFY
jgi:hypothetical protein